MVKTVKCETCGISYYSKFCISLHKHAAHSRDMLTERHCKRCGKSFSKVNIFENHQLLHELPSSLGLPPESYHPPISTNVFINSTRCHYSKRSLLVLCGRRRLLFSRQTQKEKPVIVRERAVKEIESHRDRPLVDSEQVVAFLCQGCGEDFSFEYDLVQQLEKHQERRFFCKICHERFKLKQHSSYKAYIHTIPSEAPGEQSHMCELCGKAFMRKRNLGIHRKEIHPLQRYLCCNICGKKFLTIRDLSLHSEKHSEGKRSLCCQHCGKSFGYQSLLDHHLRMHSNERPFSCETCGKAFKFKYCLSRHLKLHTGNPFSCIACSQQFRSRSSLNKHLKSHSAREISEARLKYKESQTFPCDACGEVFNKRSMLEKHFKKHLRNDKKLFRCQTCGETFDNTSKLNLHKVIHSKKTTTDDRPFSCDTCEETFRWWSDLDEHVKIHTIQVPVIHV